VHFGGPHDLESLADALGFPQPRSVIDLPPEPWAAERTRMHPAPYLIAGETLPNEQMMERVFDPGVNVCHGCAQEKYGVVF